MLCRDDQIRISQSQSSVHVWGSWHADQRVWHHTSFVSLNRKKTKMAPQGLYGVTSEILCSLDFSLPTRASHSLNEGTKNWVVPLYSQQPLRLFSCIILFKKKHAAFLNQLPRAFNIISLKWQTPCGLAVETRLQKTHWAPLQSSELKPIKTLYVESHHNPSAQHSHQHQACSEFQYG